MLSHKEKARTNVRNMQIYFIFSLAETVKGAVGTGIMLSYPLQFYVAAKMIKLDIDDVWGPFKHDHCMESSERVVLIILTCMLVEVFTLYYYFSRKLIFKAFVGKVAI